MVSLTDGFKMISTRKKKQGNRRLRSQLREFDADFMIGQSNHENHAESKANTVE